MPDMSDPLAMMQNRAENVRYKAGKLRIDAEKFTARADELDLVAAQIDDDVRCVEKWAPQPD